MNVTVKLFASFQKGRFTIEQRAYPAATTVREVVTGLAIPEQELGIMMVNSRHVKLDQELADGDTLALFPLLGGG
ncbi:thiS family protein [Geobacter sp. OR-1]|uniref:MoaD/ThiS family protein n=1 Tax=Geobacter sp. OR-1 TaxID=1266765 RepID=UPI00054305A4|nr:MoaD/ThiS family protein [Geobacter sp. OR-1]GAM11451.1 thiS family protein [Geobacter sp. OR-1]